MDHSQYLMVRANAEEEFICGHALMATAPPQQHVLAKPEEPYPHQMPPELDVPDLMKLLDLSSRLPLDGEITPVMAWAMVRKDERFEELGKEEIEGVKGTLLGKVRCYG